MGVDVAVAVAVVFTVAVSVTVTFIVTVAVPGVVRLGGGTLVTTKFCIMSISRIISMAMIIIPIIIVSIIIIIMIMDYGGGALVTLEAAKRDKCPLESVGTCVQNSPFRPPGLARCLPNC